MCNRRLQVLRLTVKLTVCRLVRARPMRGFFEDQRRVKNVPSGKGAIDHNDLSPDKNASLEDNVDDR